MTDVGDYLKRYAVDTSIVLALLVSVFVAIFGMTNWSSHTRPTFPSRTYGMSDAEYASKCADYERKLNEVGQDAVIPFVWAVPMAFTGAAGAVVCVVVLINRYQD